MGCCNPEAAGSVHSVHVSLHLSIWLPGNKGSPMALLSFQSEPLHQRQHQVAEEGACCKLPSSPSFPRQQQQHLARAHCMKRHTTVLHLQFF